MGNSPQQTGWSTSDLQADPHGNAGKAEKVSDMFTAIAPHYDLNNRLHSLGRDQAWRRALVRRASVKPSDRILDIACGTGDLTEAFARSKPTSVTGMDFNQAMLDVANQKVTRRRWPTHPTYVLGDAMNLPFESNSFDILSIAFGIRNVTSPETAIREFHRVLAPGGRLLVLEFSEPQFTPFRLLNHFYCHHVMPRTASWIARDRSGAYRYLPRSIETFMSRQKMLNLLESGGFSDLSVHPMTMGICCIYQGLRCENNKEG